VPIGDPDALADGIVATLEARERSNGTARLARPVLREPEPSNRFAEEFRRVRSAASVPRRNGPR